jgi:hypothetical protein
MFLKRSRHGASLMGGTCKSPALVSPYVVDIRCIARYDLTLHVTERTAMNLTSHCGEAHVLPRRP